MIISHFYLTKYYKYAIIKCFCSAQCTAEQANRKEATMKQIRRMLDQIEGTTGLDLVLLMLAVLSRATDLTKNQVREVKEFVSTWPPVQIMTHQGIWGVNAPLSKVRDFLRDLKERMATSGVSDDVGYIVEFLYLRDMIHKVMQGAKLLDMKILQSDLLLIEEIDALLRESPEMLIAVNGLRWRMRTRRKIEGLSLEWWWTDHINCLLPSELEAYSDGAPKKLAQRAERHIFGWGKRPGCKRCQTHLKSLENQREVCDALISLDYCK